MAARVVERGRADIRHALVRAQPLPQRVVAGVVAWWRAGHDGVAHSPGDARRRAGGRFPRRDPDRLSTRSASRWRIYSNDFLDLPARWDTGWYLGIAMDGYDSIPDARADHQQNIAFFPAFPMTMRYLSAVLGRQPLWTGVGCRWSRSSLP